MSCRTVRFSCPIGAEACTWTVQCCDGTKYLYALDENRTEDLCLSLGSTILLNSQYGSWNDINQNCTTNCGAADETPIVGYEYKEYQNCNIKNTRIVIMLLKNKFLERLQVTLHGLQY
jgi:hypothetical protein